ncbi:hypothetical protein BD413DRAFT_616442 [Trametes elegans]|nr:hypothetical protein BD413DRAFT_616442 [Trametes elegans]
MATYTPVSVRSILSVWEQFKNPCTRGASSAPPGPKIGEGVEGIEIDILYAVYAIVPCATGKLSPVSTGIGSNGAFADYVAVDRSLSFVSLVPHLAFFAFWSALLTLGAQPYGFSPDIAAVVADPLITMYNVVHNTAELRPGTQKRVLIYGIGGIEHPALQLAKSDGATVYAVDYKRAARHFAAELGAERAFSLSELTHETAAGTFTVDVVVDFVANEQSFSLSKAATKLNALDFDRPPSRIVLVLNTENLPINSAEIIELTTRVIPSFYVSIDDLKSAHHLLEECIVQPVTNLAPLEKVDQAINDLRASAVFGRKIISPPRI